jgi:undecaprenyl phosphate-alpha-L-ara4FN deformylase
MADPLTDGPAPALAIKVDVDTDRGTREGLTPLIRLLESRKLPATFLFSLGPDNTGRAISRVFRPGFLKKVRRTQVGSLYGWRTLLSGTLLPAPDIGRKNADAMRAVRDAGYPVGIHCWDHFTWQDYLHKMDLDLTRHHFNRAVVAFQRVFDEAPKTAGAPGWQASAHSFRAYDEAGLLYGSDCRGTTPFFPRVDGEVFRTLQIPTTLPTLDELLGRDAFPEDSLPAHYAGLLSRDHPNVLTIHAEIEGMQKSPLFDAILEACIRAGAVFTTLEEIAARQLHTPGRVPVCDVVNREVDGRSGTLACQAEPEMTAP